MRRTLPVCSALVAAALLGCNALTGVNDLEEVPCTSCDDAAADAPADDADGAPDAQPLDASADDGDATESEAGDAIGEVGADAASTCSNGVKDPGEGDVDCGASCPMQCADGKSCNTYKDCASGHCTANKCTPCQPRMAPVAYGTTHFCIDQTEVTNAQYAAFLATSPSTSGQPSQCAWNTSFTPGGFWPVAAGQELWPVRYVDWCDAWAYCKSQNKRLCGRLGGGASGYTSAPTGGGYDDPNSSEWMRACSNAGATVYPYGNIFNLTTCNSKGSGYSQPVNVGSLAGCKTGPAWTIYDASGNVSEWEDACSANTGGTDGCRVRGGSFGTDYVAPATGPRCSVNEVYARSAQQTWVGIRCCDN